MIPTTPYSFMLSQMIGLFVFVIAVVMMGKMFFYRKLILKLQPDDPIIAFFAVFCLLIGVILVVTHTIWVMKVLVWITIISWLFFINAILWLAIPEKMLFYTKKICSGGGYYWLIVFLLVFGTMMSVRGIQLSVANHVLVLVH